MNFSIGMMNGYLLEKKPVKENHYYLKRFLQTCLYWLVKKDSRKEERIFTYENGNQV